jgi:Flp pilus assembly protein TadD
VLAFALCATAAAEDKTWRISIPRRTKPTPVQKYNQEGVKALKKNNIKSAEKSFYKAYLIDPNDPFTLNNLGYIAELNGDIDRAQQFYSLSAANVSEATVDSSTHKEAKGKTLAAVAGHADESLMQVNRLNVEAIGLLTHDRPFEAESILQKALSLEPNNPFTMNNLGTSREMQGEWESARQWYEKAAATNSDERVIVAVNKDWRGRKIRDVARRNAGKIKEQIENHQDVEAQVSRANLRGVAALNRNDRRSARAYFEQAMKLDPENAFSLNNMGYLMELEGDKESAEDFYRRAQKADHADAKVGVATRKAAEGQKLDNVADQSQALVMARMLQDQRAKRNSNEPIVLRRRDNSVVPPPDKPAPEEPQKKDDKNDNN